MSEDIKLNDFTLDILIPTYNRVVCLEKNLHLLNQQINAIQGNVSIQIIISDNASTDETLKVISKIKEQQQIKIQLLVSSSNVGLEANTVKVLAASYADFVMFLGDDDYLPNGYLEYVIKMIDDGYGCVIPGFSALFNDGSIVVQRGGQVKEVLPSFGAVLKLSLYAHQLSGLLVRRNGLLDAYLQNEKFRNLYPFIFFVAYSLERDKAIFNPEFQVLVSQGNSKDWKYDDSGLLTHVFSNYEALYGVSSLKTILCCLRFVYAQSWRLRFSWLPLNSMKAVRHILNSGSISMSVKTAMLLAYPLLYIKEIVFRIRSRVYREK